MATKTKGNARLDEALLEMTQDMRSMLLSHATAAE